MVETNHLNELTAISPLDGRYRKQVEDIAPFASEMGLIKTRVEVEGRYLVALSEAGVVRTLSTEEKDTLLEFGPNMTMDQVKRVKEIEDTTKHDVKAMERAFREFVSGTSLEDATEMIHFGLTSEDVNNLSYRLMLDRAKKTVCVPAIDEVIDELMDKAIRYKSLPMLGRTHGQGAVPTTWGKELANFALRMNKETREIEGIKLSGKLTGAVGNFNAHHVSVPDVNWIQFSENFVRSLGFEPNLITTQINPYEDIIKLFHAFQRVNGVFLDLDQDMWRYISDDWLVQEVREGEVGSSTMPQKVNPINFENSQGNVQIAIGSFETGSRVLAVSRLQRDLADSTVVRNIGTWLAYGLLGYRNTLAGLRRIYPNETLMRSALNENWTILMEAAQTVLRRAGVKDPYSMTAELSRGKRIGQSVWKEWVESLDVDDEVKIKLKNLTPDTYIGYAERLTDIAIAEIEDSRRKSTPTP